MYRLKISLTSINTEVKAGVGNLRLFCSSEVALSGFEKTRNLNLHLIIIRFKLIVI